MDRRALFLARHDLQRKSIYTNLEDYDADAYSLLVAYLYGAAIEALRPSWIYDKRHTDAWKMMNETFRDYDRPGVNFVDFAMAEDLFENRDLYKPQGRPLVNMRTVGLILSSNEKDMRFTLKTLRTYFRAAFPDARDAPKTLVTKIKEPIKGPLNIHYPSSITLPSDTILPSVRDKLPLVPPSVLMPATHLAADAENVWKTADIWIILLIGANSRLFEIEDAWTMLEKDFPKVINKRVLGDLLELNPTEAAILGCDKEFRSLLGQLYMVRAADVKEPFEIKGGALISGILEAVTNNYLLPALAMKHAATVKANSITEAAAQKQKALEGRVAELEQKLKKVQNMEEQVRQAEALKQQLTETQKDAKEAHAEVKRLGDELTKVIIQNQKLEAGLTTSEAMRKELDAQLADLMDNRDEFAHVEGDEIANPSGVRERIGEEAYQVLCGKKLSIVGGHSNTHTTLRELFPNWQYYSAQAIVRDTAWAVDAIVCITAYVSHLNFHLARDRARSKDILFIPVSHNGPTAICQSILEGFEKAEVRK